MLSEPIRFVPGGRRLLCAERPPNRAVYRPDEPVTLVITRNKKN